MLNNFLYPGLQDLCVSRTSFSWGVPVTFDPNAPIAQERERICTYLKEEITRIARALPEHTVIPYRNIPKRDYRKNTDY